MRNIVLVLSLASATVAGCNSENEFGKCVGIGQSDRRDPNLYYDLSIWNVFWGVVGVEMIFPPILVLHHELYCPTGKRPSPVDLGPAPGKYEPAKSLTPPTNILGETK